jgi:hypothetical protein
MHLPSVTNLVGPVIGGGRNKCLYSSSVRGLDGCIYGIGQRRYVVKFDPTDNSIKEVGPLLYTTFSSGALAGNGCIYCLSVFYPCVKCPPYTMDILKIDTIHGTVTVLKMEFPQEAVDMDLFVVGESGTLANDGCLSFMPKDRRHILKFNPQDDSMICVGGDLGEECVGRHPFPTPTPTGRLVGISPHSEHVVIFNPMNDTTTFLRTGAGVRGCGWIHGNGVFGRDGNIYQVSDKARVMKFDFTKRTFGPVGNVIMFDDDVRVCVDNGCMVLLDGGVILLWEMMDVSIGRHEIAIVCSNMIPNSSTLLWLAMTLCIFKANGLERL